MTPEYIARRYRALPHFRGKGRIGLLLGNVIKRLAPDALSASVTANMKGGYSLIVDPRSRTDRFTFWTGVYDDDIISRLLSCLQPNDTVLDVGANIGWYTIPLARRLREGHVIAFEPIPANVVRLHANIELNGLQDIAKVAPIALSATARERIAFHAEGDGGSETGNAFMVGAIGGDGANAWASTMTLDAYAQSNGIDRCRLMKIDVEGAELLVLTGGKEFIQKCRPIIYAEFNAFCAQLFGYTMDDIRRFAISLGYYSALADRGHPSLFSYYLLPCEIHSALTRRLGAGSFRTAAAG